MQLRGSMSRECREPFPVGISRSARDISKTEWVEIMEIVDCGLWIVRWLDYLMLDTKFLSLPLNSILRIEFIQNCLGICICLDSKLLRIQEGVHRVVEPELSEQIDSSTNDNVLLVAITRVRVWRY